jgi:hypothetical protein
MKKLHEFPYFEVQFTKQGDPFKPAEITELMTFVEQGGTTDLFVISHGWNNDMADARSLYDRLFKCVRGIVNSGKIAGAAAKSYAILAILWPSKKFADDELIPSGAAGARSAIGVAQLQKQLDALKGGFDARGADKALARAKALVPKLEDSKAARKEFGELMQSLMPAKSKDEVDGGDQFRKLSGDVLIDRLSKPLMGGSAAAGRGGATRIGNGPGARTTGAAAGIGSFFSGIISGARNALNLTTYYQMKERAGLVGLKGVNPVLRKIREKQPNIRLHLIGHSFGGRLVTAAAAGPDAQPAMKVNTMTLLQAAFSHYGFAQNYEPKKNGFFRRVVEGKLVQGPILITFTRNDRAVGLAYPAASLLAGQVASAIGDKNSKYGGIGSNGAQKTPEAIEGILQKVGGAYTFGAGKLYNLNSDATITGHSDITKDEVAYALVKAVVAA